MKPPLVTLDDVSCRFVRRLDLAARLGNALGAGLREEVVRAVDGVSLAVEEGEVVGLVGESGCGKSTLGRIVAGILPPTGGSVFYRNKPRAAMSRAERKAAALAVQMIFQDPVASLNPRLRVGAAIGEGPRVHGLVPARELAGYVDDIMRRVGLDPALKRRYPHQFSGGQRQRIGIARALATRPELVVCDEPVSALDVAIQAQILNLLMRLKYEFGLTYVFISHDLAVVQHVCDEIAVMYLGRIVERGDRRQIFSRPGHPYTLALLSAAPGGETDTPVWGPRIKLQGDPPSPINIAAGCRFAGRCPFVLDQCRSVEPELRDIGAGHAVACHRIGADGRREFG